MRLKQEELSSKIRIIDSHAHLDMEVFNDDRQEIITHSQQNGLGILLVGINIESSRRAREIASGLDFIWSSCGIHPHESEKTTVEMWAELENLSGQEDIVAIGEIGLDFFRNYAPHDIQKSVFFRQLEIADRSGKPVIIHSRAAFDDTYAILGRFSGLPGVIHCFSGSMEEAEKYLELGYYISIPGTVTFPKADSLRDVVRNLPMNRILIETDCPYLAPQKFRGRRNEPAYVQFVAEEIARVKNLSIEDILLQTTENFFRLFLS